MKAKIKMLLSGDYYVFDETTEKYMRADGTWHDRMMDNFGTYFATREDAQSALDRAMGEPGIMIEAGKYYRTRDGRKVGPMGHWIDGFFDCEPLYPDDFWQADGTNANGCFNEPNLDLIAEWVDETAVDLTAITTPFGLLDVETQEALLAHGGPYEYWSCIGKWCDIPSGGDWGATTTYRVKPQPAEPPKPPKPREWWLVGGYEAWDTYEYAVKRKLAIASETELLTEVIHVREVLE